MKIIIVSYKRAGTMSTHRLFNDGDYIVACCKSQEEEYRNYYPNFELFVVPDEVEGNIGRKRNYILDNIDDDILMLDDDISRIGYHEYTTGKVHFWMNRDEIVYLIEEGFRMCKELGTVLWGIGLREDPRLYHEFLPFNLLSPVLGPFRGIVKNDIRNDEALNTKDDYDYFLQVVQKYHKVLRFNKYHYKSKHLTNRGGITSYRSMEKEMEWNRLLEKKWGSKVVKIGGRVGRIKGETVNPEIYVPLKGI